MPRPYPFTLNMALYNAYLENMVLTSNPVMQVILLYEKAITCLEEAIEIMEKGLLDHENVKAKYEALGRAADILTVLKATLNMELCGKDKKESRRGVKSGVGIYKTF